MAGEASFWNGMAKGYAAQPIGDEAAYQHKLAETQKRLTPDMRVLEFACGTGTTAIHHAPHVSSYLAIDYASEMIAFGRAKAEMAGVENLSFEVESIGEHAAPDGTYDAILGMSILHLLPERQAVLAKVLALLKPGGWFFSSTVCIGDGSPLIRLVLPVMKLVGKAPWVGVFTGKELIAELEAAGFEIESTWRPKPGKPIFIVARKPG